MKNGRILLKAEVLGTALGCPVCGGQKTEKARTCRSCYEKIGLTATRSIDEIVDTILAAAEAHKAANAGNVRRDIVFGPVLAQIRINENAKMVYPDKVGIAAFLSMPKAVSGGLLNLYVFSANKDDIGKEITAMVELKTKLVKNGLVHYLRAEKVNAPVRSDVRLSIQRINDHMGYLGTFPLTDIRDLIAKPGQSDRHGSTKERLIECSVGFKTVQEVTLPEGVTVNGEKTIEEVITA